MKIKDITSVIEQAAPLSAQESYDNSGLIVGNPEAEVRSALICVDITEEVMDEAQALGADMVISHHPIIFHPIRRLTDTGYVERVVGRAIKSGAALYACHTNLDAIRGGMSFKLAELLGVVDAEILSLAAPSDPDVGFGVIGRLGKEMSAADFLRGVMQKLNLKSLRHSDICDRPVKRVAICSGSGASLIESAAAAGADVYLAADFKYNDFLNADGRLTVADIGHFESEYCAIDLIYDIITKKISTFALHKSKNSRNPVNYIV